VTVAVNDWSVDTLVPEIWKSKKPIYEHLDGAHGMRIAQYPMGSGVFRQPLLNLMTGHIRV
jgi:hypothetical protein